MQAEKVRRLLQDLEIVEFDIHRLASRRASNENWTGWVQKSRDMKGISLELDHLYEKKRFLIGQIERMGVNGADSRAESLVATGSFAWRGMGVGFWEQCLEMARRESRGKYFLHGSDKLPRKGV